MLTSFTLSERAELPSVGAYTFRVLWINGRQVLIDRIVQGKEHARTPFEESTFAFVRAWLKGEETFGMTTSGSTGEPKNVIISRQQMLASASKTLSAIGLRKNSTALICIDTKYIGGKMMLARALAFNLPIVAMDPCANPLVKIPVDKCVQFTALVPYQVNHVLESKHPHLLNNLDKVLIGGAALHARDRDQLDKFQCECYETYGMTETISHIALRLVNTARKQAYFQTLPGVAISQDQRGCLVINADYLTDPVVTNDLVELVGPGQFAWHGRWDRVINSGGVKVSPERIEQQLEAIFAERKFFNRFFIAALPDEKLGNKIVLIMEGVQFSSELLQQSLQELRSRISPYEVPREVYALPEFYMTGTQKINRPQSMAAATPLPL